MLRVDLRATFSVASFAIELLLYTFDLKTFNVSCHFFPWGNFSTIVAVHLRYNVVDENKAAPANMKFLAQRKYME